MATKAKMLRGLCLALTGNVKYIRVPWPGLRSDRMLPSMSLHNTPRDVQTQAQSTRAVLADLPEPLEYGL
jgi:hypothetical protein